MVLKIYVMMILAMSIPKTVLGQEITVHYEKEDFDSTRYRELKTTNGSNKSLPKGFEIEALIALSFYPELRDTKIKFKFSKRGAPFVSRPVVWDTFFKRKTKRTYQILLRADPGKHFSSFHLQKIPFNALIGVLGHELAHTSDFQSRGLFKMLNIVFGNLSRKYLDSFEYETDGKTIGQGLGFQLLAWNTYGFGWLDNASDLPQSLEKMVENERYMRPTTIRKIMMSMDMYQPSLNDNPGLFQDMSNQ